MAVWQCLRSILKTYEALRLSPVTCDSQRLTDESKLYSEYLLKNCDLEDAQNVVSFVVETGGGCPCWTRLLVLARWTVQLC